MKAMRTQVVLITTLLILTTIPVLLREVDGGAPIFSASVNILGTGYSGSSHEPRDMEVAPDGRIYILYEGNPTFYYGAYIVYSDDDGLTWSEPIRADDVLRDGNESNDNYFMEFKVRPHMDIGPDGTVYVVWTDYREYNEEAAFHHPIQIRLSVAEDGVHFGRSVRVSPVPPDRTQDAYYPDVAVNDDGRVFVVWLDEREVGSKKNVWSSYTDNNGETWSPVLRVDTDDMYNSNIHIKNPRCVMYGDRVYVTWHDDRDHTYGVKPYIAISEDGGATFSPEREFTDDLVEGNVRDMVFPAVDDSGTLYLAWNDMRSGKSEIWFVRSTDGGGNFTPDTRLIDPPADAQDMNPYISTMDSGKLLVTWERQVEYTNNFGNPSQEKDIYFINSTDSGSTFGGMLRVDDSDRFSEDRNDQEAPVGAYASNGRVICAYWGYFKKGDGVARSLFVARHSRTMEGSVNLPAIYDLSFFGESDFDPVVGSTSTVFTFNMTYQDWDNDEPRQGFPRIQLFRDGAGTDPLFPEPIVMEKLRGERDIYYMDGVPYRVNLTVPEEGSFHWRVEVADESDAAIVRSPLLPGPVIDDTMPHVEILGPEPQVWNASDRVKCRILVTDLGGAGVNIHRIFYNSSVQGLEHFDKGVRMTDITIIDNDTVEARAVVPMYPGKDNYLKFSAFDRVGNGPYVTEPINLWLDPDAPYFENARPLENLTLIYPDVNCSITVRDNNEGSTNVDFTGVDPSSIRYSYKTTSDDFSEWMEPDGYIELDNGTYRAWVTLTFPDEGVYSRIRWRASDMVGNVVESRGFRINVDVPDNYRPVFRGDAWPDVVNSPTPHFWWDDAFDEDGDTLYYWVMVLKNNLQWFDWISVGENTFFDLPDSEALEPGHYTLRIRVSDRIGGEDVTDHPFQIVDQGNRPPEMVPPFGPFFTASPNVTISWNTTDLPSATYFLRIGTGYMTGDVMEWTDMGGTTSFDVSNLALGIGTYSLQVMAWGNGNYSRVRTSYLKISDYNIRIDIPASHTAYRGKGFSITGPLEGAAVNLGTLEDNVTLVLEGEPEEAGWIYFESTGESSITLNIQSSKGLSEEIGEAFKIVVAPEEKTPKREYTFTIMAVSEDGETETVVERITITVKDAPQEEGGSPLTQNIKDVLPFLSSLPEPLIIPVFLLILLIIIALIVFLGIMTYRFTSRRRKEADPIAERIRTYRELYDQEPSEEEIGKWREELAAAQGPTLEEEISGKEGEAAEPEQAADGGPGEEEAGAGSEAPPTEEEEDRGKLESDEMDLLDRLFD